MKKVYLFGISLLMIASIVMAQTPDFKKAMESGNQKYSVKSYNLAILDYDIAIKAVSAEVDALIASKKPIAADKKYMLEPYEKRANCAFYTKNVLAMHNDVEKVLALDSTNTNARALRAFEKYKTGNKVDGCIGIKKEAIQGNEIATQAFKDCYCSNEAIAIAKEAITSNNIEKYDDALIKANKALLILPDSGYIHGEKGKALLGQGNHQEALNSLNTAIKLSTREYQSYYSRAQVYMKLNQLDSAMDDMNKCLRLNPTFYDGYLFRADVAEEKELWNAVIYDLKNCMKMKPADCTLDYRVAVILHSKQDNLYEACQYYKSSHQKGCEDVNEMAINCDNIKYMKTHLKSSK